MYAKPTLLFTHAPNNIRASVVRMRDCSYWCARDAACGYDTSRRRHDNWLAKRHWYGLCTGTTTRVMTAVQRTNWNDGGDVMTHWSDMW